MPTYGLLGRTLTHSFSQTFFTQKFHNLELTDHAYELFELAFIEELPALLQRHPELRGLNVTIPYKEQVWPYLHDTAASAARVGAVNVIEFRADGQLIGHNTDMIGFRESLRDFLPRGFAGRALVLGNGGASKAVEVALRDLEIGYWVVSRHPLGAGLTYEELTPDLVQGHTLIINTTPLGTYPFVEECPKLPYEALTDQHYLYDLVYNPRETEFMRRGQARGASIKNGFEMLCLQAEAAWDIWKR
ncbi:shikimate dehydrogenase [Hymenobacter lutimineralis]|uniref:Shikimate dehydrogenase n=1 Tax=Hymenobacter lutimineralis TaxID=2606448 RepID=A0A5D6VDL0_9BACT|nr:MULTISPECIES: shikimate dehydrogenase [Hymenobacter]QIX61150.1 shikimate dehydrogenase [Hymenobacter sp. BT18]TYZ13367.1 shikimate dehydrogenase [Hymenobacter lutimineralis]